jgi:hypothetical protein
VMMLLMMMMTMTMTMVNKSHIPWENTIKN